MQSITRLLLVPAIILAVTACSESKSEQKTSEPAATQQGNEQAALAENTPEEKAATEKVVEEKPATPANTATASAEAKSGCVYGKAVEAAEAKAENASTTTAEPQGCGALPAAKPLAATGKTHYGKPFVKTDSVPVDTLIADSQKYTNNDLLVTGRINKVCKKKGCWFVLQGTGDGSNFVRVTMKHSFFVPTDCEGKAVTVEGTFRSVPLPEAARKHLAEDGGEDPSKVTGSAVELTMVASGVSIES